MSKMISTTYCGTVLKGCRALISGIRRSGLPRLRSTPQIFQKQLSSFEEKVADLEFILDEMGYENGNISVAYGNDDTITSGDKLVKALEAILDRSNGCEIDASQMEESVEGLDPSQEAVMKDTSEVGDAVMESLERFFENGEQFTEDIEKALEKVTSQKRVKKKKRVAKKAYHPKDRTIKATKPTTKKPTIMSGLLIGAAVGATLGVIAVLADRSEKKKNKKPDLKVVKSDHLH